MNTESIAENSASNPAYQSLSFSTSPWLILVSVLLCAACFALSWLAIKRSGYARNVLGLEFLRSAAVLLGAILLNQPEWIQDFRSSPKTDLRHPRRSIPEHADPRRGARQEGNIAAIGRRWDFQAGVLERTF